MSDGTPQISFLISTHNRRETILHTLGELLLESQRSGVSCETIVIDNASTDGTSDRIAQLFPRVRLMRAPSNRGACSKNLGLGIAYGEYIVFLDDDSYPAAGAIAQMIRHFRGNPRLGAAVFDVVLPDGSRECSAYPNVFIGCGTGFRRAALEQTGGLPEDFFMQAEEYDLSLRLLDCGWEIKRFSDIAVWHMKTPNARIPTRTTRLDTRNNLMLITRYFPAKWVIPFAVDWLRRYRWIAQEKGREHESAFSRGFMQGIVQSMLPGHRRAVSVRAFEEFARIEEIEKRMREVVVNGGIRSILLLDVGKNLLAYYRAARRCRVKVVGIADNRLARRGRSYHGIPIVTDKAARMMSFDAAIVSNLSPVHAGMRLESWRRVCGQPVVDLFEPIHSLAQVA